MSSDEEKYLVEFGKSFNKLHKNLSDKSIRILAFEADIQPSILSRLINGRRMPNIFTLKKLAAAMGLSIGDFLIKIEENIPEKIKNFDV